MKISGILPIGTVVMLKNSTHHLMITGYLQRKIGDPNRVFDYSGVPFPEGVLGPDKNFLFDHEQIESLAALGHVDGDSQAFMAKIENMRDQLRKAIAAKAQAEAEAAEDADDEDNMDAPEVEL